MRDFRDWPVLAPNEHCIWSWRAATIEISQCECDPSSMNQKRNIALRRYRYVEHATSTECVVTLWKRNYGCGWRLKTCVLFNISPNLVVIKLFCFRFRMGITKPSIQNELMTDRIWVFWVFINVVSEQLPQLTHMRRCISSRLFFAMANLRRQSDRFGNNKIQVECGKEIVYRVNKQPGRVWRVAESGQNRLIATHVQLACMCWTESGRWTAPCAEPSPFHRVYFLFYFVRLKYICFSLHFRTFIYGWTRRVRLPRIQLQFLPIQSSWSVVLPPVRVVC